MFFIFTLLLNLFSCEIKPKFWYDNNPITLQKQIDNWFKVSKKFSFSDNGPFWLIVPHAGYKYSGNLAALGYKQLLNKVIKKIIVLSPLHKSQNKVFVPDCLSIKTVLGDIDHKKISGFKENNLPDEHALGNQLPFLKQFNLPISILLVGDVSNNSLLNTAKKLAKNIDSNTAIIVSSDLSHTGPRFNNIPEKSSLEIDQQILFSIKENSLLDFEKNLGDSGNTVCGSQPIKLLLFIINELNLIEKNIKILAYENSANIAKDNSSVGYGVVLGQGELFILHDDQKRKIKDYAKDMFSHVLLGSKKPSLEVNLKALPNPYGVFVTVKNRGELRACLGTLDSRDKSFIQQLDSRIKAVARGDDKRFSPLNISELDDLKIEISVLMSPQITSYKQFNIHDGIILKKDSKRAIYLPDVIVEAGWDKQKGLEQLSKKAGLAVDAYKTADLYSIKSLKF